MGQIIYVEESTLEIDWYITTQLVEFIQPTHIWIYVIIAAKLQ